jgi:4-hydroxybenzoate polyprenyltransferase
VDAAPRPGKSDGRAIQQVPAARRRRGALSSQTQRHLAAASSGPGLPAAIFDFSRGKQALLTIAQPALGAVLALAGLPSWRVIAIGLAAACAASFALYALNDLLDRKVDARSLAVGKSVAPAHDVDTVFVRHPLASGALSLRVSVAWVAGLIVVAVVGTASLDPLALLFFAAAVATQVVYCALRSVTSWKTVLSGVMVGFGGLAGWAAVAPLRWSALSVFVFLACWEIGGRNIVNDLSDLESDARVGIRSVASVRGETAAARAAAAVAAACLVATALLPMPLVSVVLALAFGAWSLAWPAVALLRRPTPAQAASYFNHASPYPDLVLLAALIGLALSGA